jgi:hypothetical protein
MSSAITKTPSRPRTRRGYNESDAATCSLMRDKNALQQIERSKRDVKAGRVRSLHDIIKNG